MQERDDEQADADKKREQKKGESVMQIINGQTEFMLTEKSAVAIGKFDGIHRGHKELLNHILNRKAKGLQAVVFTFDPPASVFFGKGEEKELTPLPEKRKVFETLGVDVLVEFPLNQQTAAIPAEIFVREILAERMNTAYIAAGCDLSFGAGGKGNSALLYEMAEELKYEVQIIDKVLCEGREISSSYVREEVEKGNMETVALLLGEPYSISGVVQNGKQLGRKLGMPTLNLYPSKDKLLPPSGVYYSEVTWRNERFPAITNIGLKPTVNDTEILSVETYLYDFKGDLYGEEITISILSFKRQEKKFNSVDMLKKQMESDLAEGRHYHGI